MPAGSQGWVCATEEGAPQPSQMMVSVILMATAAGLCYGGLGTASQLRFVLLQTLRTEPCPAGCNWLSFWSPLAAGPGLGGTFAQAHSFSIAMRGKLSLLSSNACFPERWGGGDKGRSGGMRHGCFLRVCFFSPCAECKQDLGCFLGTLYRRRN